MIRVNLVEGGRQVEKRPRFTLPAGQQLTLIGGLVLLVTALLVGWRYWAITAAEATLDAEIAAAAEQEAQFKDVLEQVQTFEMRRQQLEQRVALIDELRRGQAVPVHIIDQVSRALPDGMWLTRLTQTGVEITIEGDCLSLTSLSDFVGNLEGSRYFVRPVEIINSEVVAARDNLPDVIHFSVKGTFQMAGPSRGDEATADAEATPATAPGGTRG